MIKPQETGQDSGSRTDQDDQDDQDEVAGSGVNTGLWQIQCQRGVLLSEAPAPHHRGFNRVYILKFANICAAHVSCVCVEVQAPKVRANAKRNQSQLVHPPPDGKTLGHCAEAKRTLLLIPVFMLCVYNFRKYNLRPTETERVLGARDLRAALLWRAAQPLKTANTLGLD